MSLVKPGHDDMKYRSRGAFCVRGLFDAYPRSRSPAERSDIRERRCGFSFGPGFRCAHRGYEERKKDKKEKERRETRSHERRHRGRTLPLPRLRARRASIGRDALASRRSIAALAGRFSPSGAAPGQASWDVAGARNLMDRQPGRRSRAVSRALAVPACPSPEAAPLTPTVVPERVMPEPPGRGGGQARAQAPHSLQPPGLPSARRP